MQILTPESEQDFEHYFALRWRLLRQPWGQARGSERDAWEDCSWHRMACLEGRLPIAVARLHLNSPQQAQLRYMAVEPAYRGRGIGRALTWALEQQAVELGVQEIILHARATAVDFYQRLGYQQQAASHVLYGDIQHYLMHKPVTAKTTTAQTQDARSGT